MRKLLVVAIPLIAFVALVPSGVRAATHTVSVSNFQFTDSDTGTPVTVVHAGDTVTWTWDSGFHSVSSGAAGQSPVAGFDSGVLSAPTGSFSATFATVGVFPYTCHVHATMNGVVLVEP